MEVPPRKQGGSGEVRSQPRSRHRSAAQPACSRRRRLPASEGPARGRDACGAERGPAGAGARRVSSARRAEPIGSPGRAETRAQRRAEAQPSPGRCTAASRNPARPAPPPARARPRRRVRGSPAAGPRRRQTQSRRAARGALCGSPDRAPRTRLPSRHCRLLCNKGIPWLKDKSV
ncbi:gremlin-2 isoform X3 [Mustela lutreola]|uniref:gremlin-2 isoform X3 n=1 Tax=Mustela lutreola TaxID=9666 RepID=UPI002797317C|nr:gremlin-2 isoform X3 [Mustela lutreola]